MSQKIAEMKEEELLSHWTNQAQVNTKISHRIKNFRERAEAIFKGSGEFCAESQEFMSLEEIRSYLKYMAQLKEVIGTGEEILDNLEKLQRLYRMRSKNQRLTGRL